MKMLLSAVMTAALTLVGCSSMTGGGGTPSTGEAVDDVTIGTQIKAAYAGDPDLSALKLNVDSTQGNVRLKGEVKTMALRRKAEDLARKVKGVKAVDNQLVITG
jgi:osmotically-inducible protein OsmY